MLLCVQVKEWRTSGKVPVVVLTKTDGEREILQESSDIIDRLVADTASSGLKVTGEAAEQEQWRTWADEHWVRVITVNIYQSVPESLQTFEYMTELGKFSAFEKLYVRYGGGLLMWAVAKRMRKKYGIADGEKGPEVTLAPLVVLVVVVLVVVLLRARLLTADVHAGRRAREPVRGCAAVDGGRWRAEGAHVHGGRGAEPGGPGGVRRAAGGAGHGHLQRRAEGGAADARVVRGGAREGGGVAAAGGRRWVRRLQSRCIKNVLA